MKMSEKVKETLGIILEKFQSGEIPEAVAFSMYPFPDVPSADWSLLNRTIMFLNGTADARGYRQWNKANRYVKKGSKAVYILVPYFRSVKDKDTGEERKVLSGFGAKPVFRCEDTDGEPLEYQQMELPELPLAQRAVEWGIGVKAVPGNYRYYGYFSSQRKEIALATREESVFFHELSHAAHEKVKGDLKPGQDALQEIVAELSAQVLCRIAGRKAKDTMGNSFRYISRYAEKLKLSPYQACMKVLSDTEKVLCLILKGDSHEGYREAA